MVLIFAEYGRGMPLVDDQDAEGLGGLALLAGLFFTALTFRLAQEGQLTDHYTKAVEQISNENADV